jgi:uncharacterized protein (TIGR02172 family)
VTDGKRVGVEFERIPNKRSFSRAISEEPERMEEYMIHFAEACRKLHATPCDTKKFASVKDHFNRAIDASRDFNDAEKARMHAFVNNAPDATTCLHGDMHMGNIITDGTQNWWIDLADFRYGHPYFDMGMLYFVCICNPSDELAQRLFHLSHAQMVQAWELFVRYYFGSKVSQEEAHRLIGPYAALYMVHFANREYLMTGWREHIENTLLK